MLPPLAQRAVEVVGSSVLSFDASDWAKPQSVWLRAVPLRAGEEAAAAAAARCRTNDHGIAVACEPEQVVVQHALRDNRGGLVAAAEPAELAVEVYEPHAGIAVWPDALDLVEGSQGTVFVKLHQRPSATVVLDVVVEGVTALAIGPLAPLVVTAPARLRFGPGDWDMAQQVRVAGNTRRQRVPPPPPARYRVVIGVATGCADPAFAAGEARAVSVVLRLPSRRRRAGARAGLARPRGRG